MPIYRNNSYTEQVLENVTKQIYKSIDKTDISLLVLYLSKAFDSVNHYLLLNKLVPTKYRQHVVRKLFELMKGHTQ